MAEKKTTEEIIKISDRILALVHVYGPIDVDDLVEKFRHYFPEHGKSVNKRYITGILKGLEMADRLYFNDDLSVSIYSDEELEELEETGLFDLVQASVPDKEFQDPEEIVQYANMFELKNNPQFDVLKEYFNSLSFKKPEEREDLFAEMIVVICKMYDDDAFMRFLQKRIKGYLDKRRLSDLMVDFGSDIPRGFLRGYSFNEIASLNLSGDGNQAKLERPTDSLKYGAYSLRECLVLAERLKQTDIFEEFCSDNLIELYIDGEEVYVQLLGYYNGDRCIIIYGNRDQLKYNYQFTTTPIQMYPDIVHRIRYCEVLMDDPGGFMTPEIEETLETMNYSKSPLIVQMEPLDGGPTLPDRQHCRLIGTVLKQLLDIYDTLGEEFGDRCVEHDTQQIVQFYADEEGVSSGEYIDPMLGNPIVPFRVDPMYTKRFQATKEIDLSLGNYVFCFENETEPFYFTVLYDHENDLIIDYDLCRESEMIEVKDRIAEKLEEKNLCPKHIVFNSEFTYEVFNELCDFYDLEDEPEIGDEILNEIYLDFLMHSKSDPEEMMIH